MNIGRIHIARFDSPSGLFKDVNEAKLAADAIKRFFERLSEREKINCIALIVISICDKGGTKRGRYGSYLLPKFEEKPAHLHITIIIDKQSSLVEPIQKYFKESLGTEFDCRQIKTREYLKNRLVYSFKQRWKHRTVVSCTKDFAERYCGDFVKFAEEANEATGDSKLVFKGFVDMKLETDNIIYDFRRSRKPKISVWKPNEVLTQITEAKDKYASLEEQENELFFPQNSTNQANLVGFSPTSYPIDNMPFNCSVNIYNTPVQSTDNYYNPF